jgi:lactate 2-monooxygenase
MSEEKKITVMPTIPTGSERELQIYAMGSSGAKRSLAISLELLEQKAKEVLSAQAYDYVAGGAGAEDTMRANREAFYRWQIVPRVLRDVSKRDLSAEILGTRLPAPVLLGPVGRKSFMRRRIWRARGQRRRWDCRLC